MLERGYPAWTGFLFLALGCASTTGTEGRLSAETSLNQSYRWESLAPMPTPTSNNAVAGLQEEILNRLKRLEFGLRREVEGEAERGATLTGSEEVPDGYRDLVEEYYRALARGRSSGGSGN